MNKEDMSNVQKLTLSAMVIALYVTVLACTQSFSFGAYQIRIATSLYALSYLFPFLVFPLGLANFIANMLFGGLGIIDMIGGCLVGILTTALITGIHRFKWNPCLMILPIVLVPGLGVSVWLSFLSWRVKPTSSASSGIQPLHRTDHPGNLRLSARKGAGTHRGNETCKNERSINI